MPIESTDVVEAAQQEVETALENLEAAVIEEQIHNVETSANVATDIALNASADASRANSQIESIHVELEHHEENDAWLRNQVDVLSETVRTLQSELSILRTSQATLLAEVIPELPEALPETLEVETTSPETMTETSSEIRTEVLPESEVERQEVQMEALPKRRVHLV